MRHACALRLPATETFSGVVIEVFMTKHLYPIAHFFLPALSCVVTTGTGPFDWSILSVDKSSKADQKQPKRTTTAIDDGGFLHEIYR